MGPCLEGITIYMYAMREEYPICSFSLPPLTPESRFGDCTRGVNILDSDIRVNMPRLSKKIKIRFNKDILLGN